MIVGLSEREVLGTRMVSGVTGFKERDGWGGRKWVLGRGLV
jgi:hypothetical protein